MKNIFGKTLSFALEERYNESIIILCDFYCFFLFLISIGEQMKE